MWLNKFSLVLITLIFILRTALGSPRPSMAAARFDSPKANNPYLINREDEISKILSVLEKKMGDQKLLEKAKDKLLTMSEVETRLVSSLCKRTPQDSYSAGADIAFLLIIILIIFS